jgi:hypothetical protein
MSRPRQRGRPHTDVGPPKGPKPAGAWAAPNGTFTEGRFASLPTVPLGVKMSTEPSPVPLPWFVTSTSPLCRPNPDATTGVFHSEFACEAYGETVFEASIVEADARVPSPPTTRNCPPTEPKLAGRNTPSRRL